MKTLILLHGALGSKEDLEELKAILSIQGFNTLSFSFSGHAQIKFATGFGVEQFSSELEHFILENKIEKPSVIGYSMGGYVALYLTSRVPSLIDKIITLGTKFNWSNEEVEKETAQLVPEKILEKIPAYAKKLEAKHGADWKELVKKTANMMREINSNNYLNTETLLAIKNPCLLGVGDKDKMVTLDETVSVYKTLSNARLYVLPNVKHPVETVNTNVFVPIIKAFINED